MNPSSRRGRRYGLVAAAALAGLLATACSGPAQTPSPGTSPGGSATTVPSVDEGSAFTLLSANENSQIRPIFDKLAANQCKAANDALPLEHETLAQADVVQKVTLLASQGALPSMFIAGTAMVRPDGDLGKADLLVDLETALTDLGGWDNVMPLAASTVKKVYGQMVSIPFQYNVEGLWYNKQVFADLGIAEPKTWDELVAAAAKLKDAGITPITQGGKDGWPVTRWIGMYIFRNAGADALEKVRDGSAKLTDPAYVAAAQAVADLAANGYFGEGIVSRESSAATVEFLTGKAGMMYNGSWFLSNINDPAQNEIGADNVGLIPFPAVSGGSGSADQWAANAGAAIVMNSGVFGEKHGAWLNCIVENYAQEAVTEFGQLSGLRVNGEVPALPASTQQVQDVIDNATEAVLWFEALMDAKTNQLATQNLSLLLTGQMSAEDYMAALQASIEANS